MSLIIRENNGDPSMVKIICSKTKNLKTKAKTICS